MSGGVVCYLERSAGGGSLRRVRLVAVGLSRSWDAPEGAPAETAAQPESGEGKDGSAVASIRSGARWVAETLQSVGIKRVSRVCVDTEGSLCAWLSAPSPDAAIIRATITQAEHDTGETAGLGAGRLLAMAWPGTAGGGGVASDTSVQALAAPEPVEQTNGHAGGGARRLLRLPGRRPKGAGAVGAPRRHRYAVLAVPDAPVRVFLDELDSRGIEVRSVMTLWHALADAWDEPREAGGGGAGSPVVATEAGSTAIVLTEPGGRLVWAWSRDGGLITGGTIRLRATVRRGAEASPAAGPGEAVLATAEGARRVAREEPAPGPEVSLEFSDSEAGRIALDWLAWSAQLGYCPRRVVCIAAPGATDEIGQGPSGLARHLARAWPGATVDAAVYDDPVGATLARLAGVRPDGAGGAGPFAPSPIEGEQSGPGAALVELSSRPGRADRGMHLWAAGGVMTAAVAIGALGWRLGSGAGEVLKEEQRIREQTKATLVGLESIDPNLSKYPSHKQVLETLEKKRGDLREQANKVRPPRPVLEEAVRVLAALEGQSGVEITEFEFSSLLNNKVQLNIPESPTAGEVGPAILDRLKSMPGQLDWLGTIPSFTTDPAKRRYILTAMWPAESRAATAPGAGAAKGGRR